MHADTGRQVDAVAAAILDHLHANPCAADSAEGVARWWLGPGHAGVSVAAVAVALDLLVARQAMRRMKLGDGTFLYSQEPPTEQ